MSEHVSEKLASYLHGELGDREVREFEVHLENCELCRGELEEFRRTDAISLSISKFVSEENAVDPPASVWESIEQEISQKPDEEILSEPWWRLRKRPLLVGATALVIVAIIIGYWLIGLNRTIPRETLALNGFVTALENARKEKNSREMGLLPNNFKKIELKGAPKRAGLGDGDSLAPTKDSKLYAARVSPIGDSEAYELVFGNKDGPYLLFVLPENVKPDFGDRKFGQFDLDGVKVTRVASSKLFIAAGGSATGKKWVLVGRDHPEEFYTRVVKFVDQRFPAK